MAIRSAFMLIAIVSFIVCYGFHYEYNEEKEMNNFLLKRLQKERKDKIWLQNRLANCTDCNLAHYSIIQDCKKCTGIASNKDGMSELYWKLN